MGLDPKNAGIHRYRLFGTQNTRNLFMIWIVVVAVALAVVAIYDVTQRQRAILRISRSSGTSATGWKPSAQSSVNTSSQITTRSARSAAPAAMGLRVGQTRKQLLRVWVR